MVLPHWKHLITGLIGLFSCSLFSAGAADLPATVNVVHPVKIFRLTAPGEHSVRVFQGQTEASDRTTLAFRVPGQLMDLPVLAGQPVSKGQTLAKLDPIEYELMRDQAEANYQLALVEFKRTERLVKDQLVSQQMHDQNRANLARMQAALEQAKANVSYTTLKAPFDGVISRSEVENWEYVTANQPILNIQSDDMTDVLIQVPQNVVTQVSREFVLDLKALVRFPAQPQYSYFAEVREVDTEADPNTLSYEVTLTLPTPKDFNVSTGMTVEVDIDLSPLHPDELTYYVVPATDVVGADGNAKVWKIDPQTMTVSAIAVERLGSTPNGVKVQGALGSGDMLALTGAHLLSDGMRVQEWIRERGL